MKGIVLYILARQGLELLHVNEVYFQCIRQKAVPVGIFPEMEHAVEIVNRYSLKVCDINRNHIRQQAVVPALCQAACKLPASYVLSLPESRSAETGTVLHRLFHQKSSLPSLPADNGLLPVSMALSGNISTFISALYFPPLFTNACIGRGDFVNSKTFLHFCAFKYKI